MYTRVQVHRASVETRWVKSLSSQLPHLMFGTRFLFFNLRNYFIHFTYQPQNPLSSLLLLHPAFPTPSTSSSKRVRAPAWTICTRLCWFPMGTRYVTEPHFISDRLVGLWTSSHRLTGMCLSLPPTLRAYRHKGSRYISSSPHFHVASSLSGEPSTLPSPK